MPKIALIARGLPYVEAWRRDTGIDEAAAVWIAGRGDADHHAPFTSMLLLPRWMEAPHNTPELIAHVRSLIVTRQVGPIIAARNDGAATTESDPDTDFVFAEPDDVGLPAVDGVRRRPNADWTAPSNEQERELRAFGVNPGLIGMLGDLERNTLTQRIEHGNDVGARVLVERFAAARGIRAWVAPEDHNQTRREDMNIVHTHFGSIYDDDFNRMSDSHIADVAHLIRQMNDAERLGDTELAQRFDGRVRAILTRAREEYAAGFLPTPVDGQAEPAPVPGPIPGPIRLSARPREVYRPPGDPVRDNLRDIMRRAAREDAERRAERSAIRARRRTMPGTWEIDEPDRD